MLGTKEGGFSLRFGSRQVLESINQKDKGRKKTDLEGIIFSIIRNLNLELIYEVSHLVGRS